MKKEKVKTYIFGILIPIGVGLLASLLTMGNMDIYSNINKPPLTPPSILFPIVWTILYILMGVSCVMIFNTGGISKLQKKNALYIYFAQLAVNFFWSIIFLNLEAFLLSFIVILALWLLILLMIIKFEEINGLAGLLQIPYLIWVTFAGYLNLAIYLLNR